jgi:carboxyl-terminal processing protease
MVGERDGALSSASEVRVTMRARARLLACSALLILLVSIAVAGTAVATTELGPAVSVAETPSGSAASAPPQKTGVTRQAYDLLLDNFVTPPRPATLLAAAAGEIGKQAAERQPGEWSGPTIADDALRDEAWADFEAWLDRVELLLAPVVDRSTLDEMVVRALPAALAEHHTRYLDPRQNEEHQAWRRGEVRYEGIGARLRRPSTVVLEVFPGSPAERAGLRTGDRIVAIDGQPVADSSSESAIVQIRGPLGSSVELDVERRGVPGTLHLAIEREEIKLAFMRWDVVARGDGRRFGYLQIRGFPEPSVDERVAQALSELDRRGIDGLILDLRGNSGGRIDVGLRVASRFLRDGVLFQQVDRTGRERQVRPAADQYWEHSVPIVTLVDGGTASMGEIVAAALQEAGAGRVVGTPTAGSVAGARMYPLANGGALQITVLTITSGRGAALNDVGITPDEAVDLSDDDLLGGIDAQLEAGLRFLMAAPRQLGFGRPWIGLPLRAAA